MGTDSAPLGRRTFLRVTAAGAGAVAVGSPLLAACGGSNSAANGKANSAQGLKDVLPRYTPSPKAPKPDLPDATGPGGAKTDPAYLTYPKDLVKTVDKIPGSGGTYTAIMPLWGPIPPAGSAYFQAVNTALGANMVIKPAAGNDYASTVPTLVAGNKLPDWLQLPAWWNSQLNVGELATTKFADLTPYLAGDKISQYPNLAALPTRGWQDGAWNNKLYGIPSFTSSASFAGVMYYRKDVLAAKGVDPKSVKDADSLLAIGKELTSTRANVWAFDSLWLMIQQMFDVHTSGVQPVTVRDGKAISMYDTPEYEAALAYAYKLAKSGYVHPDALAHKDGESDARFHAGHVLVQAGGSGAWNQKDAIQGQGADPKYVRDAFTVFMHDGSTPRIPLRSAASVVSYLNRSLSDKQLRECLAIANYLAAPFGSVEYTLVNYGVENVHWTRGEDGPVYTTQGTKESNQNTYQFLASSPSFVNNPGYQDITRAFQDWSADAVRHAWAPPYLDMNITTPARFASASSAAAVNDLVIEVSLGTKTVADFTTAAANWKTSGGQQLIDWVQKNVVDVLGTGQ